MERSKDTHGRETGLRAGNAEDGLHLDCAIRHYHANPEHLCMHASLCRREKVRVLMLQ